MQEQFPASFFRELILSAQMIIKNCGIDINLPAIIFT